MNIHKHKSQSNNKTNNNNQLTPELNHHLIPSRNSRSLAQALPTKNKRWNSSSQKPAFTIIEVVLVLAIAGLIFLMVFIALPALQRSQRDAQRKQDISRLQDAVERYKANNRGQIPWPERPVRPTILETINFLNGYLNQNEGKWQDPSGIPYEIPVNHMDGVVPGWRHPGWKHYAEHPSYNRNLIFVDVGSECNGNTFRYNNQPNSYVILYGLEGGGSVCVDG